MEGVHGIDVSWLHQTSRDNHAKSQVLPATTPPREHTSSKTPQDTASQNIPSSPDPEAATAEANGPSPSSQSTGVSGKNAPRRPALLHRSSNEKTLSTNGDNSKQLSRRGSWISNLSAKFSSAQNAQPSSPGINGSGPKGPTHGAQGNGQPAPTSQGSNGAPHAAMHQPKEELEPYVPQPPRSGPSSFFSNAFRRLSSGNQALTPGKAIPNGGVCPRRVLNVDPNRERCALPELKNNKLRRVAFCVDVEIAGGPRYKEETEDKDKRTKQKPKKASDAEDEESKSTSKPSDVDTESKDGGSPEPSPGSEAPASNDDSKQTSKKKEKKKRSEAERKERKEKKRRKAEENGTVPLEITRDDDSSRTVSLSDQLVARAQDRPTTDPVRIYRRCCQLRETPILKRIVDQLTDPAIKDAQGIVPSLDLTGSRLQYVDLVTLADWLAVVPVTRLILEDSDLTDAGVRVILSGLYCAKPAQIPVRRHHSPLRAGEKHVHATVDERSGFVEKLSLKNNPRISKEGWKTISAFINMCRSLKALDVSMIPFPQRLQRQTTHESGTQRSKPAAKVEETAEIFSRSIADRLAGARFEELIMAECCLSAQDIDMIIHGVTKCGVRRLGLAGNKLDDEGLQHVLQYVQSGVCHGLDLAGNDLQDQTEKLAQAFTPDSPLWALSLADCNLVPESLKLLFPALTKLPDFRFIDLSHNQQLFSSDPSALGILRKYIPQLRQLKRIHLLDVSMSPAQAIGLAEVLPENPHLAHLNILENPMISSLSAAEDESSQEEACALYASLMAAVRVSNSMVCVDVDVPGPQASEVVKALAKQVVAYCLRNLEKVTAGEGAELLEGPSGMNEEDGGKEVQVPEVLLHLVGHGEGGEEDEVDDGQAPDNDYIVGGTGVVKALSYCLHEKASDMRPASSGTATPNGYGPKSPDDGRVKAKIMSKNLLDSARKIRMRLRTSLLRESKSGDDYAYRRLVFLDQTLQGMIQRFEDEYPECRQSTTVEGGASPGSLHSDSLANSTAQLSSQLPLDSPFNPEYQDADGSDIDVADSHMPLRSRHNSDVSLASRALALEEAQIHRLGQTIRRDILNPQGIDPTSPHISTPRTPIGGSSSESSDSVHFLQELMHKLSHLSGDEFQKEIQSTEWIETMRRVGENKAELERLENEHPEEWKAFKDAQMAAQANMTSPTHEKPEYDVAVMD